MGTATREQDGILAADEERPIVQRIEELFEQGSGWTAKLVPPSGEEGVELPDSLVRLLRQAASVLAQGDAAQIVPIGKELTTQQAAALLNVSRQYLVRLLDDGEIPYRKIGTHRRIGYGDLMEYRQKRDSARQTALDQLDQLGQGMGIR